MHTIFYKVIYRKYCCFVGDRILGNNLKILVIGLGEIGYTNAEYFSSKGLWVEGFDISTSAIKKALADKVIKKEAKNFEGYDYYLICISTHKPTNMFMPDLEGLYQISHRISKEGKTGALVGLDSTIPQGTTSEVNQILKHRLHVVHVPHRYFNGDKEKHGVNQIRVIGSCESCCLEQATKFYNHLLDIPLHRTNSAEVAELTKVVENAYRYLEISFAEELKMICDKKNIDFYELRSAINTKWNIEILEPRKGIGGHCLPKDSDMFLSFAGDVLDSSLIKTAKKIDHQYRLKVNPLSLELQQINETRSKQMKIEVK